MTLSTVWVNRLGGRIVLALCLVPESTWHSCLFVTCACSCVVSRYGTQFCACSLRARTCTDPYRNFTCAVGDSLARSSNVLAATGHAVLGREAARLVLHVGRYVCGDAGPMALGTGTIRAHM